MQKMLRNAVLGRRRVRRRRAARRVTGRAAAERAAKDAAAKVAALESPLRLSVDPASVEAARAVLARYGASYTLRPSANKATFLIANPGGLTGRRAPVRSDAARRTARRRRSRHRISSALAKPARARPGCRLLGIASASPVDHETIGMDDARQHQTLPRGRLLCQGKAGAPRRSRCWWLAQSRSPALADIIGARRVRTAVMISSGSMPCR